MHKLRFPCPCCGYIMFSAPPGSEERCAICGWIDDINQLHFPAFAGRPNGVSLLEAQRSYNDVGAKDGADLSSVRFAGASDERDPNWRPLDDDIDDVQSVPNDFDGVPPPEDPLQLYYWLPKP